MKKSRAFIFFLCLFVSGIYLMKRSIIPFSINLGGVLARAETKNEPVTFDPLSIHTEMEIKLLESLAKRRKELQERETKCQKKETTLFFFEQEINKKIKELKSVREILQDSLKSLDQEEDKKIQNLAKICQNMKPQDTAKVFNQLDAKELISLISLMNPKNVSLVLGKMDPTKTKDLIKSVITHKNPFSAP